MVFYTQYMCEPGARQPHMSCKCASYRDRFSAPEPSLAFFALRVRMRTVYSWSVKPCDALHWQMAQWTGVNKANESMAVDGDGGVGSEVLSSTKLPLLQCEPLHA
jgi:hypothetical protein